MILQVFSIFDKKAESFITPFFLVNEQMAIRTFTDCVQDENHMFGKHPEDYILYQLGEWDTNTAEWTGNIQTVISALHISVNSSTIQNNKPEIKEVISS